MDEPPLTQTETDPIDSAEPLTLSPKKDIPKPIVKTDKEVEKEEKASPEQRGNTRSFCYPHRYQEPGTQESRLHSDPI